MSCDLLPTESPGPHWEGDVREVLDDNWDLMIAHPPCTHLAVSGARWFKDKKKEQEEALAFVRLLLNAAIPRIALENPISVISSKIRKPNQIVQPWWFGHGETKSTCLWLKNLPKLVPTNITDGPGGAVAVRHIILISGKDSLATALVQRKRLPDLPYEFVFNETGWELPESWEWISRVEGYLGKPILRLGDDLDAICREENCLPLAWRRFCTRRAKIEPLENYLGKDEATIYLGLRADEPERVGYVVAPGSRRQPAYPLREVGMGIAEVWRLCESVDLLPPQFHWAWMENRVRQILCGDSHLIDGLEPWERGALFAWRSRNNCSICFFKRLYEWVGLWEFYPSIFSYGCELEA